MITVSHINDTCAYPQKRIAIESWIPTINSRYLQEEGQISDTKVTFYLDVNIVNILGDNFFKLFEFKALKKGWDGYDARALSNRAIKRAEGILLKLSHIPQLFPTGRGSIQIEYYYDDSNLIELEVSRNDYYLYSLRDGLEIEKRITKREAISSLNDFNNER